MPKPAVESEFSKVLKKHFPGERFRSSYMKRGGKILAAQGEEAVVAYLQGKSEEEPPNFQPPAKCHVVTKSRDFAEWPIMKASEAIQRYIYALSTTERAACKPGKSSESHAAWFAATGVSNHGYSHVQGLNLIFDHTLGRYDGVLKKVQLRNEKARARLESINASRADEGLPEIKAEEEEVATNETGHLLQPPGINPSFYVYQTISPQAYRPRDEIVLPPEYAGYVRDPNAPIPLGVVRNRCDIQKGCPGYIPEWQREAGTAISPKTGKAVTVPGLSPKKNKRMRRYWRSEKEKAQDALLVTVRIGTDWVVIDVRGLLRNARWRTIAPKDISLNALLDLFTGDPVIDVRRNIVTFTYTLDACGTYARKWTLKGKQTKATLDKLTATQTVALVAIDLGQTNPISAGISRVTQENGALQCEPLDRFTLPDDLLKDISAYRIAWDRNEEELRARSVEALPEAQQAEVRALDGVSKETARTQLCADFGLDPKRLPWDKMSSNTTFISEALLSNSVSRDQVFFTPAPKKGAKKKAPVEVMRKDRTWARAYKPRLSVEAQKLKNEALWALKRTSPEYLKLSRRKEELCRRSINYVIEKTRRRTQCQIVIPVIEDLNVRFFHGSGKRLPGWDNFFTAKKENRWFIQGLHKAFSDLRTHRSFYVFEVRPERTSITCPKCGHCEVGNRDGEAFQCLSCGKTCNADLDVATHNLTQVALTGKTMPKREEPRDAQGTAPARKTKKASKSKAPPAEREDQTPAQEPSQTS